MKLNNCLDEIVLLLNIFLDNNFKLLIFGKNISNDLHHDISKQQR